MFVAFFLLSIHFPSALAFPYSVRTEPYNGWSSSVRGDINTLGMGGATLALPHSISAAESNPAGFAMGTDAVEAQFNTNSILDRDVQMSDRKLESEQYGLAVSPPPWGFGITYYVPSHESNGVSEVSVHQLRFSVARLLSSRLSVGLSAEVNTAFREIGGSSFNRTDLGIKLGALYKLPGHWIFGLSLSPENTIPAAEHPQAQNDLPGFNQSVILPAMLGVGAGWIPNRFFKLGFSMFLVSASPRAALLADQSRMIGEYVTLQPRFGANYRFVEFKHIWSELSAGGYYEVSRISGTSHRMHGTVGLEIAPYVANIGIALDGARDYRNLIFSLEINIVRTLRYLDLIPKDPVPPYDGFFPNPLKVSADALPAGLTVGEKKKYKAEGLDDVGKILEELPDKVADKLDLEE